MTISRVSLKFVFFMPSMSFTEFWSTVSALLITVACIMVHQMLF
jgi:hypothetical protein